MYKSRTWNTRYFYHINTVAKAYWLGLLYADGNIRKDLKQVRFSQHIDNQILLKQFCHAIGFNSLKINIRNKIARLWVSSKEMCLDLIQHGCIPNKSKKIRLPKLESRKFYLAFALGYYDGDGKRHSTIITSGSQNFLKDIKFYFKLPYKLRKEARTTWHDQHTRCSPSLCYELSLGKSLMIEMLDNYTNSLASKRQYHNKNIN